MRPNRASKTRPIEPSFEAGSRLKKNAQTRPNVALCVTFLEQFITSSPPPTHHQRPPAGGPPQEHAPEGGGRPRGRPSASSTSMPTQQNSGIAPTPWAYRCWSRCAAPAFPKSRWPPCAMPQCLGRCRPRSSRPLAAPTRAPRGTRGRVEARDAATETMRARASGTPPPRCPQNTSHAHCRFHSKRPINQGKIDTHIRLQRKDSTDELQSLKGND
jgi:hypothetical protein